MSSVSGLLNSARVYDAQPAGYAASTKGVSGDVH